MAKYKVFLSRRHVIQTEYYAVDAESPSEAIEAAKRKPWRYVHTDICKDDGEVVDSLSTVIEDSDPGCGCSE